MVVIVILLGLTVPVAYKVRESTYARRARAEEETLLLAIKGYYNIFGKWPGQTAANDVVYFTNNHLLIRPLIGENPRSQSLISIETNSLDANTNYLDPYGTPYLIFIAQSGAGGMTITLTNNNVYSNVLFGARTNTFNYTSTVPIGVGAFLKSYNTIARAANTWDDEL